MYIPKNKIKANLYTNGNEYQFSNGQVYVGHYFKLSSGKVFAGKNLNDSSPNLELFPFQESPTFPNLENKALTPSFSNPDGPPFPPGFDSFDINISTNQAYMYLKTNLLNNQVFNLPYQFFPKPTEADYKLGVFTRYFCVKINEPTYLELNKETFDSLTKKDSNWSWESYFPFSILWTIKGDKLDVERTNYNMVILQEKRMKRVGLKQFLRGNYRKFLKS